MWKVGLGLAVTAMALGGAARARAEEPVTAPSPAAGAPATPAAAVSVPCPPPVDVAAEQRAFNREMERYLKLAALTKKLAEDAAAEAERQFDAAVTLFMRKRELTLTLGVAPQTPAPAAAPARGGAPRRGYDLDDVR
jgi:hypothetical protein